MLIKVVNGIEYLDYEQAAKEYGLKASSIPPMVSRGVFTSIKFDNIVTKFIDRPQLEAYKSRKQKISNSISVSKQQVVNEYTGKKALDTRDFVEPVQAFQGTTYLDKNTVEYLDINQKVLHESITGNTRSFTLPLSDKDDSKSYETEVSYPQALTILIGLFLLFLILKSLPKQPIEEVREEVKEELTAINVKTDDIPKKDSVVCKLLEYPRRAKNIKYILDENRVYEMA